MMQLKKITSNTYNFFQCNKYFINEKFGVNFMDRFTNETTNKFIKKKNRIINKFIKNLITNRFNDKF